MSSDEGLPQACAHALLTFCSHLVPLKVCYGLGLYLIDAVYNLPDALASFRLFWRFIRQ